MSLNLNKPVCFFDLETTGINTSQDRIVELAIIKVNPNGTEEVKTLKADLEEAVAPSSSSSERATMTLHSCPTPLT